MRSEPLQATIRKWGNSLALRLPRHVADQARLVEGTTVELVVEEGTIRITASPQKFRLADLLAGEPQRGDRVAPVEHDWGEPKGEEAW